MANKSPQALRDVVRRLLILLGEDPARLGLKKTPARVAQAFAHFTKGYGQTVDDVLNGAVYPVEDQGMVLVRDIEFFSLCEHHLLPFFGKCHVAYIPDTTVIGLSKIPRVVEIFSRRLQIQERLTAQVSRALQKAIQPLGVAVVMEAQHLCMMMRGVEKQAALAVTSSMLGIFRSDPKTRMEFLNLLRR